MLTQVFSRSNFTCLVAALILSAAPALAQTTGNYTLIKNVAYGSDPLQNMDVYEPAGTSASVPVIVMIHGGGWIGGSKGNVAATAAYFAQNGYAVANLDYRISSPGVNLYPVAIGDVASAISWIKTNAAAYNIDAAKVAACGMSVGGYYAVAAANAGEVNALIDFYGPVDLADPVFLASYYDRHTNAETMDIYLGSTLAEDPTLYAEASPLNFVTAANPPTLIFHGLHDTVVPVLQSEELATKLGGDGVACELQVVPNAGHSFLNNPGFDSGPYLQSCLSFLNALFVAPLPPGGTPPSPTPPPTPTPTPTPTPKPTPSPNGPKKGRQTSAFPGPARSAAHSYGWAGAGVGVVV